MSASFWQKLRALLTWISAHIIARMPKFLRRFLSPVYQAALRLVRYKRIRQARRALLELIAAKQGDKPLIIFAPSLDWSVQLFQRPQQLALALARQGAMVLYFQPKPDFSQPPFQEIHPNLYLCNIFVQACDVLESPTVYFLTWNCGYVDSFRSPRLIYDFVDDIKVFYADHELITRYHYRMLRDAELVLVTAHKLLEEVQQYRTDAVYCPNGVDYEHFQLPEESASLAPPQDLAEIVARHTPVIGYYGALARWFDYDLLKKLTVLRPNYSFILIGPDYDGTLKPAAIDTYKSIHWLGVKPYNDLPGYLKYFDATMIPFQLNDITHATSPLKLFEYMAGGKPTVVTPMRESMGYEGVLVGRDAEDFAARLDEALTLAHDPEFMKLLDRVARENTWDARACQILSEFEKRSRPAPQPAG